MVSDDKTPIYVTYTKDNFLIASNNLKHITDAPKQTLEDDYKYLLNTSAFAFVNFENVFNFVELEYGENGFTHLGNEYLKSIDSQFSSNKKKGLINNTNINFYQQENSLELLFELSAALYSLFLEESLEPGNE